MNHSSKLNMIEVALHLAAWLLVLISPLLFAKEMVKEGFELNYLAVFFFPIVQMVMFYTNYVLLVPKMLFRSKLLLFVLSNLILIVALSYSIFYVHTKVFPPFHPQRAMVETKDVPQTGEPKILFSKKEVKIESGEMMKFHKPKENIRMMNDVLVLLFVCVIAILLRFTMRWFASLSQMKDLEREKIEVELKNLKSQLNPHFLFNTLNNIYVLIGVNQEKAQQAVMDLSKLLRYALYEGQQRFVTLEKEVEFVDNYIKLMKLRLTNSVAVTSSLNVGDSGNLLIAQMLFITLVENAFKHGVSLTQPSFINMQLNVTDEKKVVFTIENSSFPKGDQDKSGSGIGIENLKRRLELIYPGSYTYEVFDDGQVYKVELSINLKEVL